MNVKELRSKLANLPDDMPVIIEYEACNGTFEDSIALIAIYNMQFGSDKAVNNKGERVPYLNIKSKEDASYCRDTSWADFL